MEWGCANCHKPSWKTGDDNYVTSKYIAEQGVASLSEPDHFIHILTSFQHRALYDERQSMVRWSPRHSTLGSWLDYLNTGAEKIDLHDCRARTRMEAIMWHCSEQEKIHAL